MPGTFLVAPSIDPPAPPPSALTSVEPTPGSLPDATHSSITFVSSASHQTAGEPSSPGSDGDCHLKKKARLALAPLESLSEHPSPSQSTHTVALPSPSPAPARPILLAHAALPGSFDASRCYYPRAQNAQLHPLVASFLAMDNARRAARYCALHPGVNFSTLLSLLEGGAKTFAWSGADLFSVITDTGARQMVVIECNSCPSGQKSMPAPAHDSPQSSGFHALMRRTFLPLVREHQDAGSLPFGALAVVFDKNHMEARGYAAALADEAGEPVLVCELRPDGGADEATESVRWESGVMYARVSMDEAQQRFSSYVHDQVASSSDEDSNDHTWVPVRAAFRYVTQRPWSRIPLSARTLVLNPPLACLAGGRNKAAADAAYAMLNAELSGSPAGTQTHSASAGLSVRAPGTVRSVSRAAVPAWVRAFGGRAVVKDPYSNAGQNVFTILTDADLAAFLARPGRYEKYIVQSLIGHREWVGARAHFADATASAAGTAVAATAAIISPVLSTDANTISADGSTEAFERYCIAPCPDIAPVSQSLPSPVPAAPTSPVAAAAVVVPASAPAMSHTGTVPDSQQRSFVADLRMMISSCPPSSRGTNNGIGSSCSSSSMTGFQPLAMYARRAAAPLEPTVSLAAGGTDSWAMLGTNLSVKRADGGWDTDTSRLLLMDAKDFHTLGIGLDELIDGFVQTVLATVAIDRLAGRLANGPMGGFDWELFESINADSVLAAEVLRG